jgi:signal transduction histidine kinase/CheY-like chemotaxis protein
MADSTHHDSPDTASVHELKARLRDLEGLIARVPIPIAIARDPDCRNISANAALAALLKVPTDVNVSLTPPPGEQPSYRIQRQGVDIPADELPMQYAIAHRTSVRNEIEIVLKDGTVRYVQNDVEPLFDAHGEVYGCVSVVVDLTERKLAEDALRNADRLKDEFLATLSHELRNPLAPIRNALEVMRLAGTDTELVEHARAIMERQLLQLVRITDDLLDVSRITQNKLDLRRERIDLRTVLEGAAEATRPLIDAERHVLTLDLPAEPAWVDADFSRLAQAFANLLNNAAKYTEPGGRIRIGAVVNGTEATVSVTDNGIGIPPALLPRIFDMFMQFEGSRDRAQGGLGLGLTLVKRLVELHGGTIQVHSDGPGHGSEFVVRLPLAPTGEALAASPRTRSRTKPPAGCRILIAEDNPDAAEMLRIMLTVMGQDVRVAWDGVQAVALAETFEPQIALLDIGMPRMDGYEAARRIRGRLGTRVVLVALTGWGQDDDIRRAREAGFDRHFTKPAEPEAFEELIAACAQPPPVDAPDEVAPPASKRPD